MCSDKKTKMVVGRENDELTHSRLEQTIFSLKTYAWMGKYLKKNSSTSGTFQCSQLLQLGFAVVTSGGLLRPVVTRGVPVVTNFVQM
jgi:hypothetical protein